MMRWHLNRNLNEVRERALLSGKSSPGKRSSKCKGPEVTACLICRTMSRGGSVAPAERVRRRVERLREQDGCRKIGEWKQIVKSLADHTED